MTPNYKIVVEDDTRATFSADFRHASSPILLDGNGTPFQVADARHSPGQAAELLIGWCASQGGEIVGDDEEYEVVEETYGDLHDYTTGAYLRPATEAEFQASEEAAETDGGAGVIEVDGRSCYVEE